MPPPFRKITLEQFAALLNEFPFHRRINAVHMHHTWRPNRAQYHGHDTIVSMWRFHTSPPNNWRDIAQHLSIAPDGALWLGRDWNLPPASSTGFNGTSQAGPFMFEMIGDFDTGKDPFDGAQKETSLKVSALVQDRFHLPVSSLKFHNQMTTKTCPGSSISYARTLEEVRQRRNDPQELPQAEDGQEGVQPHDVTAAPAPDASTQELIGALMRGGANGAAYRETEEAFAEPGEEQGRVTAQRVSGALRQGGEEGLFGPTITTEMKEQLRPYVINLSQGRFSTEGKYATSPADADAIFGEHLEAAISDKTADKPLRIVLWAHGGLVNEAVGLDIAYRHSLWWERNDVYPLYFVWETGIQEALGRIVTGRSTGEEGVFDRLAEFTDQRIEDLARILPGRDVWADIKHNARLASDPAEGGAYYVAQKLAAFCQKYPGRVELHAVGHSAGSNFHSHFLPAAQELDVQPLKTLLLLAPAIRVDRFKADLMPLLGAYVSQTTVFTMNKLREADDNCLGVYHKSLLYLIYHALENERETPILGLEISLRGDPDLCRAFGLGGAAGQAIGEVVWSKTPVNARPRYRSESLAHGDFDDDDATMNSIARRILNQDVLPFPYEQAAALASRRETPQAPLATGLESLTAENLIVGAETIGADDYGVPFDVLDAFERAAESASEAADNEAAQVDNAPVGIESPVGPVIAFGPNAVEASLTAFSRRVLEDILHVANIGRVVISSTSRTPGEQARVMYHNLQMFGVEHQKRLYGSGGDQVIEVYRKAKQQGKSEIEIRALMTQEIVRIGPTHVSRHASDPKILNVFDVAPNSVVRQAAFVQAVQADRRVSKFLQPPADPGFHLEIPQPPA